MTEQAIKVGVIADQTGPLSFVGIANANVAKMVINDINAKGGLLGRQIDLYLEDSATIDSVAEDTHVWVIASSGGNSRELTAGQDRRAHHRVARHRALRRWRVRRPIGGRRARMR